MPAQLILEFEGVTTKEYDAVNAALGIDPATGAGDWPDGLQVHAAGLNEDGHLVVTEIWDTPEHQARFMEGRLGAALVEGGDRGAADQRDLDRARRPPHAGGLTGRPPGRPLRPEPGAPPRPIWGRYSLSERASFSRQPHRDGVATRQEHP